VGSREDDESDMQSLGGAATAKSGNGPTKNFSNDTDVKRYFLIASSCNVQQYVTKSSENNH